MPQAGDAPKMMTGVANRVAVVLNGHPLPYFAENLLYNTLEPYACLVYSTGMFV